MQKSYYSCPDAGFVKYVPQWMQHLAIAHMAGKLDGKVAFYAMEDYESLANQLVVKGKLDEGLEVDGFIFFTLRQFLYRGELNLTFLTKMLESGYSIHFAREDFSITDRDALDELFPLIYATQFVFERDESADYWDSVDTWLAQERSDDTAQYPRHTRILQA